MRRIERQWRPIEQRLRLKMSSGQVEAMRVMFYAGAAACANVFVEAEKSPDGARIIEDLGRELMAQDPAPAGGQAPESEAS